jgi:cellulose synthase/poly-beta-1,6-N-acetylglucosamine synthase-like glycosyltransferase
MTDQTSEMTVANEMSGAGSPPPRRAVSVIICAYTLDRWELLCSSVDSVLAQTEPPVELFLSIDHNHELFDRCRERWDGVTSGAGTTVTVVENRYGGHLGSARTTAAELAHGEIIAFLDDDAAAEPDWLAQMVVPFEKPEVIAVGGRPLPVFSRPRPRWFPLEYDWVFGCSYLGLPTTTAPILHVIGAAMSVRRADLEAIGYFHSDNHDDMDMCHRLLHHSPSSVILYEPSAVVHHYVHENRLTWDYFWKRCFMVNRGKVKAFRDMGAARNLSAERRFAKRALSEGLARGGREFAAGDRGGLERSAVLCVGLALAGLGYATGTVEWELATRRRRSAT